MMHYCDAVGLLNPFTSIKYRSKRLGPLAEEPAMETERHHVSVMALDALCVDTLPFGVSKEKCLSILSEQLPTEKSRQLLDDCRIDFQTQVLRSAGRSMGDKNYTWIF